ncbi:MAG: AmmeMemoRadiSam system protein B [Bryobacteraceae bacterium]|jgi:AmmeMemoRadiSam system protein B|nr:AmmeMemoRadiSam system protein B [Bryobacteraceae bacterium]
MTTVRKPAVAGTFYPADVRELHKLIIAYLAAAAAEGPVPKAIIAPHAGYIYSGPVAASAYAHLAKARGAVSRVVLLGPAHWVAFSGLAASSAEAFVSPLGAVPVDRHAVQQALGLPHVCLLDKAHAREHSLEVQLPFLQEVLGDFSLVPLVVGEAAPEEVADVLDLLWGGPETAIVISSDLSHYYDYETARRLDQLTSRAIEQLRWQDIRTEQACGYYPVRGFLYAAQKHHLSAKTVDVRNSGDTAGPRDEVVGYGAYVFTDRTPALRA